MRSTGKGVDPDAHRLNYVMAVNKAASEQNSPVGDELRRLARELLNQFMVDGEQVTIIPYQLQAEAGESFAFRPENRLGETDRIHRLFRSPADRVGGSDLELAKFQVMQEMARRGGPTVGLIFTNDGSSRDPKPEYRGSLWNRDPANRRREQDLAARLGVRWEPWTLSTGARDLKGRELVTWVLVGVRTDGSQPAALEAARAEQVAAQNARHPGIPPPEMTAPTGLKLEETAPNKVKLTWNRPTYAHDGYDVILREKGTYKPVDTGNVPRNSANISIPETGKAYQVTVAATRGARKERGYESAPVEYGGGGDTPTSPTGDVPGEAAAPDNSLWWVLGFLALLLAAAAFVMLRSTPLCVNGNRRVLKASRAALNVVPADTAARGPVDVQVDVTSTAPGNQPLATIRRELSGKVEMRAGTGYVISGKGGGPRSYPLPTGTHTVHVRTAQEDTPVATLSIEVGATAAARGGSK